MSDVLQAPRIGDRSLSQQSIIDHTWTLSSQYLADAESDPSQTAKRIANMALDYQTSDEGFKTFISHFWLTILWLAKQLPHSSHGLDKIVALLVELQKQTPPPLRPQYRWSSLPFWKSLPGLTFAVIQYRYGAPLCPPYAERPGILLENRQYDFTLSANEWTNLNAFLARLLAAVGHQTSEEYLYLIFHLSCEGLYCLLDALEDCNDVDQQITFTAPAACWILYSGRQLNQLTQLYPYQGPERETKRLPWSAGDMYQGAVGFNKEHWAFWKERFKVLKEAESLQTVTREWAKQAWEKMEEIDSE
jgi:hypothetical protein